MKVSNQIKSIKNKITQFEECEEERPPTHPEESAAQIVRTEFPDWCEAYFAKPLLSQGQESDPNSELFVHNQIRDRKHAEKKRKARAELEKRGNYVPWRGGGGGNGEMANLTNEKGEFAIAIFRHFSPLVVFEIKHFRHQGN